MKEKIKKLKEKAKNSKGFTLIELIVVIAVLGILVLLAAPKFLGHTNDAKLAQVKGDIKTYETVVAAKLVEDPTAMETWPTISKEEMEKYITEGSLFSANGGVQENFKLNEEYIDIPDGEFGVKSPLKGNFIMDKGGKIYYQDENLKLGKGNTSGGSTSGGNDSEDTTSGGSTNGDVINADGSITHADGTITGVDGKRVDKDGNEVTSEGIVILKDGSGVKLPNGEFVSAVTATDFKLSVKETGYYTYIGSKTSVYIPSNLMLGGSPITNARSLFSGSSVEKVVLLENNITDMTKMFYNSQSATLDLSYFNTSNVTNMVSMFEFSNATELDLRSLDTSKVTNFQNTFRNSKAKEIKFSDKFVTNEATNMSSMFFGVPAESLDVSNFVTNKVTNTSFMFSKTGAKSLDLSKFDTSIVTNMQSMFAQSQATEIKFGEKFLTAKVANMAYMFQDVQAKTLDLSTFDTAKVYSNTSDMFKNSATTTGYARTKTDADKFNSSTNKPTGLTFIVK